MKLAELFEKVEVKDRFKLYDLAKVTDDDSIESLANIIKQNCKTMLKAYQTVGKPLYRGINSSPEAGYSNSAFSFITGIRQDRKPVQMGSDFHDVLHNTFVDMGIDVTRKNSIFCTSSFYIADMWGEVTIIFVKDGWKGLVFEDRRRGYTFGTLQGVSRIAPEFRDKALRDTIKSLKPKIFSSSDDLAGVIKDGYEDILITGDSYIAVKLQRDTQKYAKLLNLLGLESYFE